MSSLIWYPAWSLVVVDHGVGDPGVLVEHRVHERGSDGRPVDAASLAGGQVHVREAVVDDQPRQPKTVKRGVKAALAWDTKASWAVERTVGRRRPRRRCSWSRR